MRILAGSITLALSTTCVFAATPAKPGVTPIYAELMTDVRAHKLQVGASIFARVTGEWEGRDCALRDGAILEAHVVSVVPPTKAAKGSQVDLAFTKAQCGTLKMSDFGLMLAAMSAPPGEFDLNNPDNPLPFDSKIGGGQSFLNIYESAGINFQNKPSKEGGAPIPKHMKMGDVSGIKGLKLSVGTGPDNSSVLSSTDHDVALDSHTVLLLVPAQGAIPRLRRPIQAPLSRRPPRFRSQRHYRFRRGGGSAGRAARRGHRPMRAAAVQRGVAVGQRERHGQRRGQHFDQPAWLCSAPAKGDDELRLR